MYEEAVDILEQISRRERERVAEVDDDMTAHSQVNDRMRHPRLAMFRFDDFFFNDGDLQAESEYRRPYAALPQNAGDAATTRAKTYRMTNLAKTLTNYGVLQSVLGHHHEALDAFEEALALFRDSHDGDKNHRDVAQALRNVGYHF